MFSALLLLLSNPADAMQLALDRPAQCALADTVVVAEVTTIETRWTEGPQGGIEQVVWFAVDHVVKGDTADTLKIVLPGGTMGGLTQVVEDVPTLIADQSYLLMLDDGDPVARADAEVRERVRKPVRALGEGRVRRVAAVEGDRGPLRHDGRGDAQ